MPPFTETVLSAPLAVSTSTSAPCLGASIGTIVASATAGISMPPRPASVTVLGRLTVSRVPVEPMTIADAAAELVTSGTQQYEPNQ